MTALHRACQQSDATFVQLLLEHDLNVNEQDVFQRCPLALAAWRNNVLGVAYLLDRGADREIRDIFGATPLLRAIQYAAVDAASVLLESKCDVLAADHESQTLLHRAAPSRDIPTIELLAGKGYTLHTIDTNAKDNSGKTAKERLQTVEPSAELLKAFTAMIAAIESAKKPHRPAELSPSITKTSKTCSKTPLSTNQMDLYPPSAPLPTTRIYPPERVVNGEQG
jgi:Ankyrin repeats (3 copies)